MEKLTALSFSIALLSGVATFLAVGPLSGLFLIWAATIAWAAYFFLGADKAALKSVITCGTFGVFMAWLGAIQITNIAPDAALGFSLMASIAVTVTVLVTCLAANIPQLSCIPASVLGYSATFAYLLQTPEMLNKAVLFNISLNNPLLLVPVSIVIGAYFGQTSAKFAEKLTRE
jgi:hypothetical protein